LHTTKPLYKFDSSRWNHSREAVLHLHLLKIRHELLLLVRW